MLWLVRLFGDWRVVHHDRAHMFNRGVSTSLWKGHVFSMLNVSLPTRAKTAANFNLRSVQWRHHAKSFNWFVHKDILEYSEYMWSLDQKNGSPHFYRRTSTQFSTRFYYVLYLWVMRMSGMLVAIHHLAHSSCVFGLLSCDSRTHGFITLPDNVIKSRGWRTNIMLRYAIHTFTFSA